MYVQPRPSFRSPSHRAACFPPLLSIISCLHVLTLSCLPRLSPCVFSAILSRNEAPTTREENEDWEMLKRAVKLGYAEITPQHENLAKVRSR